LKSKSAVSFSALTNPAGGLFYQWRAFRFRKKLWGPFRHQVAEWLNSWARDREMLVLVGPSAGYTLPRELLLRFRRIVVVEPDAAAFMIFQARFLVPAVWEPGDYFGLEKTPAQPEKLNELFERYPSAAILFCNVLGQLPVLLRDGGRASEVEPYMLGLSKVFRAASRSWPNLRLASYHDRFSRNTKHPNEIIDHMTGVLFEGEPHLKEFPWRLTPQIEHQVEFWVNS
jgi:hypothetical protein